MTVTLDASAQCARCANGTGCGAGLFSLLFKSHASSVVFARQPECESGDRVRLDIPASLALKMAFVGYCLPVLAMLLFAAVCQLFISTQLVFIAGSGILGLFMGLIGGLIAYPVLSGSVSTGPGRAIQITQLESGSTEFAVN